MGARRLTLEMGAGIAVSLLAHVLFFSSEAKAWKDHPAAQSSTEVELQEPPTPPAPAEKPAPEPEPAAEEKAPEPVKAQAQAAQPPTGQTAASPPAQAPAQAGQTMTAPETPGDSQGITDFSMVQGAGTAYAGGTTASNGTSQTAVHGPVAQGPVTSSGQGKGPVAQAPVTSGPDRSRPALPAASNWNCSHLFPSDPEAGDTAAVTIVVTVRADGSPQSIHVTSDPGHGFGAAARACALGQRYSPALDRSGQAIMAMTAPITVRFSR